MNTNSAKSAQSHAKSTVNSQNSAKFLVWGLVGLYILARFLQVYPGRVPMLAVVALHVFPPAIFALVHGARVYRRGGILMFMGMTLLIANFSENLSLRTGFPFGHYYFTDLMGPKLGAVPMMLALAYLGMAYLSWTLAQIILGAIPGPVRGSQILTLPLLASSIMLSWDLSQDPIWSTVLHAWVWEGGGKYFGVPTTNFCGWFLTLYLIYQLFAIYLLRRQVSAVDLPASQWRQAVFFYGASTAGNLLLVLPQSRFSTVTDSTGKGWQVSTITETCGDSHAVYDGTVHHFGLVRPTRKVGLFDARRLSRPKAARASRLQADSVPN